MSALITYEALLRCSLDIGSETGDGDMAPVVGALRKRVYDETLDVDGQAFGNSYLGWCYTRTTHSVNECLVHAEGAGQVALADAIRSYLASIRARPFSFFTRKDQTRLTSISALAASAGLADIAETILGVAISDNDLATITFVNQCLMR